MEKQELLDRLWPGVIVTEASVQRAVSLARSALRSGGWGASLRNHPKKGYRFCDKPDGPAAEDDFDSKAPSNLREAHRYLEAGGWEEARHSFNLANEEGRLAPLDCERGSHAAQCSGDLLAAREPLERAVEDVEQGLYFRFQSPLGPHLRHPI